MERTSVEKIMEIIHETTERKYHIGEEHEGNFKRLLDDLIAKKPTTIHAGEDNYGSCFRIIHRVAFNYDEIKSYGNYGNYKIIQQSKLYMEGTSFPYTYYTFELDSSD